MSDGTQFVAELTADEKAYAGLAHALLMSTWWAAPLIIYFVKKGSRFVRFHVMQALLLADYFQRSVFRAVLPGSFARAVGDADRRIVRPRQD